MIAQPLVPILIQVVRTSGHMYGRNMQLAQMRAQLSAYEVQLEHRRDIAEIQASLARSFIHALIERRIDAVQSGFAEIMALYAEQARGFLQQQEKYSDADLVSTDPLESAKCRSRLNALDLQLAAIRDDSRQLYHEMNQMLLLIGAAMPTIQTDDRHALALPDMGGLRR